MKCQASRAAAWSAAAEVQALTERVGLLLASAAMSPHANKAVDIAAPGDARPQISSPM
jgi:RNase P/RNase MRP subunit p30